MNQASGFTLLEVLLVVFLIGLIAVIAAPQTPSTDKEQRANAESFLLETFRTARQEAQRSSATCGVNIDSNAKKVRYYRYDPALAMAARKVYADNATTDFTCLQHPVTRLPLDQTYGSGSDYPRLALTYNLFRGVAGNGTTFRTGDIQFDSQGRPWVFNGANDPVPLTVPDPTTQSPVVYTLGALTGGLIVCQFTGRVLLKSDPNAANPCTL